MFLNHIAFVVGTTASE